ncbi:hypothetical protein [Actinomadura hibisca]|uniref:hypothetical protein n=1 Tax=Actinomadura hibisca TaxID=68565 RepID=UPI00082A71E6|nr:hypothetical protein [Actinomadura hibisca]
MGGPVRSGAGQRRAGAAGPPPRVLVTSPRARAPRRSAPPVTREIDEQTGLGEAYMRSLVRAQFRLALLVCAVAVAAIGGLPLLFAAAPRARTVAPLGVPLAWLLLAGAMYPAFVAGGWWYVRHAERNERDFAALVTGADPAAGDRDPLR